LIDVYYAAQYYAAECYAATIAATIMLPPIRCHYAMPMKIRCHDATAPLPLPLRYAAAELRHYADRVVTMMGWLRIGGRWEYVVTPLAITSADATLMIPVAATHADTPPLRLATLLYVPRCGRLLLAATLMLQILHTPLRHRLRQPYYVTRA